MKLINRIWLTEDERRVVSAAIQRAYHLPDEDLENRSLSAALVALDVRKRKADEPAGEALFSAWPANAFATENRNKSSSPKAAAADRDGYDAETLQEALLVVTRVTNYLNEVVSSPEQFATSTNWAQSALEREMWPAADLLLGARRLLRCGAAEESQA